VSKPHRPVRKFGARPPPQGPSTPGYLDVLATSLNISAPKLAYEPSVRLLTGNGPQAIDQQTAKLRTILTDTPAHQQQAAEQVTVAVHTNSGFTS